LKNGAAATQLFHLEGNSYLTISTYKRRRILNFMADQEVVKHTKKILGIWKGDGKNLWHKIQEFLTEIVIIVFAVSISIWFHNWSEHKHEQAEVKQFLIGLREDLTKDVQEMNGDKQSYVDQAKAFRYIGSIALGDSLRADSLKKYAVHLFNLTWLNPNAGRFEGFKASGKIGEIENYELQTNILDLYQEDIPSLLNATSYYVTMKKDLMHYIQTHRKRISKTKSNIAAIMADDEVQNISQFLMDNSEIVGRYDSCIRKMETIKTQIDEAYGPAEIE